MRKAGLAGVVALVAVLLVPARGAGAAIVQPGDLLVVDYGGAAIKRVDRTTGAISLVAAGGLLSGPLDVAVAPDGSLFVADTGYSPDVVIRIDGQTGTQSYVTAASADLQEPRGIALDADGKIVLRSWAPALALVDPRTGLVTPIGGDLPFGETPGVDVGPDGSIYTVRANVVRGGPADVLRIDAQTGALTVVSTGGPLVNPARVAVTPDGTILVTDPDAGTVVQVDPRTGTQRVVTRGLPRPLGIKLDGDGSILVSAISFSVAEGEQGFVIRVNPTSGAQTVVATERNGQFAGLAVVAARPTRPVQTSLQADPVVPSLFQLRARLTETQSGVPLGGQVVTMSTAAGQVCQATTDADGVATCDGLPAALSIVVENGYTAVFAGSSHLGPSSLRGTLLAPGVTPAPTPVREPDITPRPTGPSRLPAIPTAPSRPSGALLPATGSNDHAMPLGLAILLIAGGLLRATRRARLG